MQEVKITWDDAGAFGGDNTWMTKEKIKEDYEIASFLCVSIGFLVFEDKDSIVIAQNYEEEYGQYSQPMRIPKAMVIEIKRL